jgi:hypothetical protein
MFLFVEPFEDEAQKQGQRPAGDKGDDEVQEMMEAER